MYSLLIAFALCAVVSLILQFAAGLQVWLAIPAGLVVFTAVYVLLVRRVMKKLTLLMETAQRDIQAGRAEKAIKTLQSGYALGSWQFYVKEQINSQIGTIYYLKRDFSAAFEYLDKGFVRHWVGMGMLGVCYMRRNQPAKMIQTFDKAVSANRKEDLLWNLYAYCLEKIGERAKAIAVLEKGLKKAGDNEIIRGNLEALKEGKKPRMKAYGDLWLQFHLEKPGAIIKHQTKAVQGRRKIVRR